MRAAVAVALEAEDRRGDGKSALATGHGGEALTHADGVGQVAVEPLAHLRFVVVQVHLRRGADHVQVDGPRRLGGEVGQTRLPANRGAWAVRAGGVAEERGERQGAEAAGTLSEGLAAGFEVGGLL